MKYESALGILETTYEKAKLLKYVHNPVEWALYQTWKTVDRSDRGLLTDERHIYVKGVEVIAATLEDYDSFTRDIGDEAVKAFSKFLIDRSEDGCVRIDYLPDLLMQWRKGADNESNSSGIRAEYKNGKEYFTVPEGKPTERKSAVED